MSFFAFVIEIFTENPAKQCFRASGGRQAFKFRAFDGVMFCSPAKGIGEAFGLFENQIFDRFPWEAATFDVLFEVLCVTIEKTDRLTWEA